MKLFLITLIMPLYLFSITINCIGDVTASKLSGFETTYNASYAYEEIEDGFVYGTLDTVNYFTEFYDSDSAVCGGSKNEIITVEAWCNDSLLDACWDVKLGKSGLELLSYDTENSIYKNTVIVVNGLPCMPKDTQTFTAGIYHYDTKNDADTPFAYANLNSTNIKVTAISENEANDYRAICSTEEPSDPNTSKDYTPYLETIIDNTSENKAITEINDRDKNLNDNLDDLITNRSDSEAQDQTSLDNFKTSYENTLDTSFSSYADVFGFGEYGEAPPPITFTMFERTYEVFNIAIIDEYIELIRSTFSIFAYLFGIIIVFRSV